MATCATEAGIAGTPNSIPIRNALLYWVGSGLWLAFSAASALTYPFATNTGQTTSLGILQAVCFALSFFIIGLLDHTRQPIKRYTLVKITALSCTSALLIALFSDTVSLPSLLWIASTLLAVGRAAGFCQWLRMLQAFSLHRAKHTLIMGSAVEIALTFLLVYAIPETLRTLVVFGLYAPLGLLLLAVNVHVNGLSDEALQDVLTMRGTQAQHTATGTQTRRLRHELALPVVCAMALTLITPIANTVFGGAGREVSPNELLVPLSHAFSLVVLSALWFAAKIDITLPQLYCVFLPVLASIVLAYSLVGTALSPAVLFVGNCGYFFVSLLMVTTCLGVAERRGIRVPPLYGLFAGCVYLTDAAQLALDGLVADGMLDMQPYVVALLLLYVLMIPTFFLVAPILNRGSQNKEEKATLNQPSPVQPHIPERAIFDVLSSAENKTRPAAHTRAHAFELIAQTYGLSPRQTEVMGYLASGRDVDHVAEALHLSPNTIRSYRKQLYAALGIHGLQELIDLVEQTCERS